MAKKVQKETKKVQKKEVVKKEPEKITIEVQETVSSMFFLILLLMICWPEVFVKIAAIAKNGDTVEMIWCSFIITLVLGIYAGIFNFGKEKIKKNK